MPNLFVRPGHQHHTVGLQTLALAACEQTFLFPGLIDEHSPQTEPRSAALAIPQLDQPALTFENFGRQLAAVLARLMIVEVGPPSFSNCSAQ